MGARELDAGRVRGRGAWGSEGGGLGRLPGRLLRAERGSDLP